MSNIEQSFTFLQDGIPQWLQDIARVESKITAMQNHVTKVAVSLSPFGNKKSGSVESIKPERLNAIAEETPPSNGAQTDPLGNRKRKTLSALSGRASGPLRYRPKQMVVMDYDGDVQKSFESLVRAIGAGRNMLRKAKMEAKMSQLAALAGGSSDDDDDDDDDVDDLEEENVVAKIGYRPRMSSMRARTAAQRSHGSGTHRGSSTPVELFDTTDKTLEDAQGLCEKAAHLTLRDGDCRKELESVRKGLEHVLTTAKAEVLRCTHRKSLGKQQSESQASSDTSACSTEPPQSFHLPVSNRVAQPNVEPKAVKPSVTISAQPPAKFMDIEVDDEEDDDDASFVMPPVRLTSRLAARV
ncbi:hypothetical protein IQ07DRAFT_591561 [Pyrenochaeta sp. DS3sAY3a]|nr:hypothetical protein IQ07DRAFT_591561 [Pyrenochaeta sp. DS3sAY3a]